MTQVSSTPSPRKPLRGEVHVRWSEATHRFEARKMVDGRSHSEYGHTADDAKEKWRQWYYGPKESPVSPTSAIASTLVDRNPEPQTIGELFDRHLAWVKLHRAYRTWETYSDAVEGRLRDEFGAWPFADLRDARAAGVIGLYFDRLIAADEYTTTINRIKTPLQAAITWAKNNGWITVSPMQAVVTPKPRPGIRASAKDAPDPEEDAYTPTADEIRRLNAANRGDRLWRMWAVQARIGLRPSELVALGEDSLRLAPDGTVDRIAVHRKMFKSRGDRNWRTEQPKWASSRIIRPSSRVIEMLLDQARDMRAEAVTHVDWDASWTGLLWRAEDGNPFEPTHVVHLLHAACARARLPNMAPYALRRFALSQALESGASEEEVAQMAGHSVATLRRHYAKVLRKRADRKSLGERMEELDLGDLGSEVGSSSTDQAPNR